MRPKMASSRRLVVLRPEKPSSSGTLRSAFMRVTPPPLGTTCGACAAASASHAKSGLRFRAALQPARPTLPAKSLRQRRRSRSWPLVRHSSLTRSIVAPPQPCAPLSTRTGTSMPLIAIRSRSSSVGRTIVGGAQSISDRSRSLATLRLSRHCRRQAASSASDTVAHAALCFAASSPPNPSLQRTTHGRSPVCGR